MIWQGNKKTFLVISKLHNHHLKWLHELNSKFWLRKTNISTPLSLKLVLSPLGWNLSVRDGETTLVKFAQQMIPRGFLPTPFCGRFLLRNGNLFPVSGILMIYLWCQWLSYGLANTCRQNIWPNKSSNTFFFGSITS